jgi:ABC-type transport system substrate-binding protein
MRTTYGDQAFVSNQLKSPGWTGQVHDAELDALITVADTTLDPAARIAATQQAMIYVLQKGLLLPIHSDVLPVAVHDDVHGFRWDAINRVRYIDIWIAG